MIEQLFMGDVVRLAFDGIPENKQAVLRINKIMKDEIAVEYAFRNINTKFVIDYAILAKYGILVSRESCNIDTDNYYEEML